LLGLAVCGWFRCLPSGLPARVALRLVIPESDIPDGSIASLSFAQAV